MSYYTPLPGREGGGSGFDRNRRDVARPARTYIHPMTHPFSLSEDAAWAAFEARDRAFDGRLIVAVTTTRIYCKPTCPARRPKREHVEFFDDADAARAAGYRACLRCKPDEVGRDRIAVAKAVALIEAAEENVSLDAVAAAVGYAPHHFHRLFKRATGVTPAAYARGLKARRAAEALSGEESVTGAIYEAGYSAPSRFYETANARLGMSPSAWKRGGAGVTIRWTIAETSLGPLLIAATDKGLCRVAFEENAFDLTRRFPAAEVVQGGAALAALAARVVAEVESPGRDTDLPLDVRGTAFQEAVWQALRTIPPGETRTYGEIAVRIGAPKSARAVGRACATNQAAVVIPGHRAVGASGALTGYRWGEARKERLLAEERRRSSR